MMSTFEDEMKIYNIKTRKIVYTVAIFCSFLFVAKPVEASKEAVLDYITNLPNRNDGRVISGEYIGPGAAPANGNPTIMSGIETLHQQTGEWIGMVGGDYYWFLNNQTCNYSQVNPAMVDYWNSGGLVTLTLHMCNPYSYDPALDTYQCGYVIRPSGTITDFDAVLTPGTSSNTTFMREMDKVAQGLQQLKNAGAVVLFRPYHEANCASFWWGQYQGRFGYEGSKRLWRFTHDYYTNVKGLDNLIWVYSPCAKTWGIMECYPGDQYVDMVAFDTYTPYPLNSADTQFAYDTLTANINKPIAFGEFGERVAREDLSGNFDYAKLTQAIKARYPRTSYFQAWWTEFSIEQNANANGLLGDSWVINRDDICIPGVQYHEQGCDNPPPPPITNLLQNPSFESGEAPWSFFNDASSDQNQFSIVSPGRNSPNAAKIFLSQISPSNANIQLNQNNITLQPNTNYRLTFDAYSNTGHDTTFHLHKDTSPYTNYGLNNHLVQLNTDWQSYAIDFTTPNFPTEVNDARLRIWFPGEAQPNDEFYFDNFNLVEYAGEITAPAKPSGLLIR